MITEYHRPLSLDEAIALAGDPDAVILGGGTTVNADPDASATVAVDLQALDLAGIATDGNVVRIGATTRLQDIVESGQVPMLLADLARREAPNTIRNAATIGGTIAAADPESQLVTGLLAFGATVSVQGDGSRSEHSIGELLNNASLIKGSIITTVSVPTDGTAAADRTARTPLDQPIVMAVAHRGSGGDVVVAIAGVAHSPVIVDPERIDELEPPSDFRGSAGYRRHLAAVLAGRVIAGIGAGK